MRFVLFGVMIVGLSSVALADSFDCKKTETQPECFARLKCQPNEELDACQKRLRAAAANGGNQGANGQGDNGGDNGRAGDNGRGGNDRGDNGRGDNDRGDNDRGDSDRGERRRGGWREDNGGRRRRGGGGGGGHGAFEANKTFGLGLELGEPTGVNGKVFVRPSGAIDFGVGEIYDTYYYGNGLHLYADYLWHPVLLGATPSFELPFYVGVGARFWDFNYCVGPPNNVVCYDGSSFGIRVPLGIDFDFNNVPLDIFLQVVPVLDFVSGDYYAQYRDREHFGIDASVGIRFWFK